MGFGIEQHLTSSCLIPHRARKEPWFSGPYTEVEQDMSHELRNLAPMSWCTLTRGHSSSMIPHRARKEPWFSGPYTEVEQDMSHGLRNLAPMSWCTLTSGH
ncbi:hypothetical protein NDU88_000139 [Pleurodeles waltl]|uniref:Uncharacterized protein n=1 Tax=Pleurodeles waltl TaxID=8319 RepID=A0AAV7L9C9_PLEWA|nr:hypothetical protein NDU88_000139 [Pleurodeles waltl]